MNLVLPNIDKVALVADLRPLDRVDAVPKIENERSKLTNATFIKI